MGLPNHTQDLNYIFLESS